MNRIDIIGNAGAAPEIRNINKEKKVANFSVATTERYKDSNGQKKEVTTWHRVVAWNGLAEIAEKHVTKGKQLRVTGKMSYRNYTDQNGVEHNVAEIIASEIELLGGPKAAAQQPDIQAPDPDPTYVPGPEPMPEVEPSDDLPF